MQWENLTGWQFEQAVKETGGVCVVAMGVVERHGRHLPLGTDYLNGHKIASMAAEKEPAVVFPPFYFGQIYEARCFAGTITLKPTLLVDLILGVFDEIGRNGFRKIVLFNAHGGNRFMIPFLQRCCLWENKSYCLYLPSNMVYGGKKEEWLKIVETTNHNHACECETSITLANYPELVRMEAIPDEPSEPLKRLRGLPPTYSALGWYADYPEHYAGDARPATAEKGVKLRELMVDALAEYVAAVKRDEVIPDLRRQFDERMNALGR